jgi:hypothetical protein
MNSEITVVVLVVLVVIVDGAAGALLGWWLAKWLMRGVPRGVGTSKNETAMVAFRAGIGKQWRIGSEWGRSIRWCPNYAAQRVCGWMEPKPKKGDWLLCDMKSGQTGLWRFGEIEDCVRPEDMFFADVEVIGYVDKPRVNTLGKTGLEETL